MRILLIEDDEPTAQLLEELFGVEGHANHRVPTGEEGLDVLRRELFDVVVLDVMLPGRDGYSVCAEMRTFSSVPVLMLSARGEPDDRVDGLRIGADDYLPKPFHAQELLARIEALVRRGSAGAHRPIERLRANGLVLDEAARSVFVEGRPVELTGAEFDILRALVERTGRVVPRERLMELARGSEFGAFDRAVDVHISNIRKKLGDDVTSPRWIRTIRGVGYQVVSNAGKP